MVQEAVAVAQARETIASPSSSSVDDVPGPRRRIVTARWSMSHADTPRAWDPVAEGFEARLEAWRERYEKEAARVARMQGRIAALEEELGRLQARVRSSVGDAASSPPVPPGPPAPREPVPFIGPFQLRAGLA